MKKIAICMPCWQKPESTKRAIESILAQTVNNWDAYIIGDGCPQFQKLMEDNRRLGSGSWEARAEASGNEIIMFNGYQHYGGWGYAIRNYVNFATIAKFIAYLDNDDTLEPNHFENYLAGIEGTAYDFVYFNSHMAYMRDHHKKCGTGMLPGLDAYIRDTKLQEGKIGHAELIIRSSFLKQHPEIQETAEYGHDWLFIKQMIDAGAKYQKAENPVASYNIMGAGELRETDID